MPVANVLTRLRPRVPTGMARAYLATFVVSSLIVSTWFRAGTFVSTGDMGAFIRRGWSEEMAWSWNHQITGAGSAAHTIGRAIEFFLIDAVRFLGADETVAQWLFYTLIYGLVSVGAAYAAGAIVKSPTAVVAAGTFAVLNGFFLTRLPNPLNIISVGTIALFTGIALRVAKGRKISPIVGGVAFLPCSFLAFNPPMMVVAGMWAVIGTIAVAFLIEGRRGAWRLSKWLLLAGPWVLLLNAWWLMPFVQAYTGGGGAEANATFTDPTNWSWAQINNSVPNILTLVANWAWFRPQYLPFAAELDEPHWIWMRYLIPTLVVLAPALALRARRRPALGLLGLSGIVVFLAKGLLPPFASVNMWMYLNVPMFWLFREPMSKLGQTLVVFFAILLAIAVEGAASRLRAQLAQQPDHVPLIRQFLNIMPRPATIGAVGTAGAFLLIVAYPKPLYTGEAIPDVRPMQPSAHVRVPDFWWDMAKKIDEDPRPGKVLVLPLDDYYQMPTTWGFFGVDSIANLLIKHPVVQPKPDGYFGDVAGFAADVDAIELALMTGDLDPIPSLLDATGVSEVIIRHDLLRGMPGRNIADDRILAKSMAKVTGVSREVEGTLELWQVGDGTSPIVRTYDRVVDTASSPEAGAAVLGSIGTGSAIRPRAASEPAIPTQIDNSPALSDDSVYWPIPAVDEGKEAATKIKLREGNYQVSQRARASSVLIPELDQGSNTLLFRDPTRILLDGKTVSNRPPLEVSVPTEDIAAIRVGSRFVSLAEDQYSATKSPTVVVGAATPLTVFAPAKKPAEVSDLSNVYDCNNYEPRPTAELELEKSEPKPGVTRLSALDHAACTRIDFKDAQPGDTYRVQLQYRQVKGKRPQICLWQVGTEGCEIASRPQIGGSWTPYEKIVTIDETAESLQLILHADVGERLLGKTVTDYRNIEIEKLDPIKSTTIWPESVPATTVEVPAGKHTLKVVGGMSGSSLAPFEPLQDCFRYDDQTMDEAGLSAEIDGDPNNPTFTLTARTHMACLGATIPDMGDSSLYELGLEAQSVRLRNPKFCLYLRGPDSCEKLPTAPIWDGWTSYQAHVSPSAVAVETRLYLYGLRDLAEKEVAEVQYRNVKLRPVASPSALVMVRQPGADAEALKSPRTNDTEYDRINPANYKVSDLKEGQLVALAETIAPGWQMKGGEKTSLNGWMNSWKVEQDSTSATMTYAPAKISRMALMLLPVGILAAIALLAWQGIRRARKARKS